MGFTIVEKKSSRQGWLKSIGFIRDPFHLEAFHAETDPLLNLPNLPSYVDSADTKLLVGNIENPGPNFIFSRPGGGKSSLIKRIHYEYNNSISSDFLLVDYIIHNYSLDQTNLEDHLIRIYYLIEEKLPKNNEENIFLNPRREILLEKILEICRRFGYRGIYILVDGINDEKSLAKIKSLMMSISLFDPKSFIFKFFFFEKLLLPVQFATSAKKFQPYLFSWGEKELSQVLSQRLIACLDSQNTFYENRLVSYFCEGHLVDIVENSLIKLGELANSPRIMWQFGNYLFDEIANSKKKFADQEILLKARQRFLDDLLDTDIILADISLDDRHKYLQNTKDFGTSAEEIISSRGDIEEKEKIIDERIRIELDTESSETRKKKPLIFLCYALEDKKILKYIFLKLLQAGYNPFMDIYSIDAGRDWDLAISIAVKKCDFFMFCISKNSYIKRGYLRKELSDALEEQKKKLENDIYLIPIRFDSCPIPREVSNKQCVDIFNDDNFFDNWKWERLLRSIAEGITQKNISS